MNSSDVLLLARKNPDLQGLMQTFIDERKEESGKGGAKKSKVPSRMR